MDTPLWHIPLSMTSTTAAKTGAFDELKARSNTIDDEGGSNATAHLHGAPSDRVARRSRAAPRERHRRPRSSARLSFYPGGDVPIPLGRLYTLGIRLLLRCFPRSCR